MTTIAGESTRTSVETPVVAEGLVRRFGDVVAVDGIDLSVRGGEIFGFLGPNGAGKTTTIRMLTTLLKPTGGRALVAGHDVVREPDAVRRSIGVALQEAALDPLMTGRELLRLQAVLHGIGTEEARARSERLLDTVGLTAAADRRVATYSGGMRRRLDLALALMHEPIVLFLDEPTTGLDPNSRLALWDELRSLNSDFGTTIFLTTQYMEEADRLTGRIAIIDFGRIVAQGTPAQLKARVGEPTLRASVAPEVDQSRVEEVLRAFGTPHRDGDAFWVRLSGGASQVGAVARALEDAGVPAEELDLHNPTLDDVFHEATGRRLEGAEAGAGEGEVNEQPR
ncbi:MAG TPA: ATP-binding cassette domain-containing protein [Actinomycetota bacterium]|jgi:ABC-2 type transport system ATP-binding protein|nr:ATP-binding cassette domain-containing protein [Actinomycetota bacterium]